jgi:hypothetical protein
MQKKEINNNSQSPNRINTVEINNKMKQLSSSSSSSSVFLRKQQQQQQQQQQNCHLVKQNSLDMDDSLTDQSPKIQVKKAERLQDPLNMLKKTLMRSNINSATISPRRLLPKPVGEDEQKITPTIIKPSNDKVLVKQYSSSSSSSLTQTSGDSKPHHATKLDDQIETISELDNEQDGFKSKYNYYQRAHQLLHTDSLSSDPSDCVSQRNSICLPSSIDTKRITTSGNTLSSVSVCNSKLAPASQQPNIMARIKRVKIKASKQHSLSSSDEYDEYEDVDEEIRSTTEYTTNDEMDIESGSVSEKGAYLRKLESLDKNFEKEEVLAAKMKKFLSV